LKFPERINKILPRVLKPLDMDGRINNWAAIDKWAEIVGASIARHARATHVDTENLFVSVDNPVWQGQLFIMKAQILEKMKTYGITLKDIRFSIQPETGKKRGGL
jgi:Dna[CI] antecedent, DciA